MTQNRETEFEAFFPHENVMHVLEREQTVLRSLYQGPASDFSAGLAPGANQAEGRLAPRRAVLPFNPLMPFCPAGRRGDVAFEAGRPVIGSLAAVDGWIVRPVFFEPYAASHSADAGMPADAGLPAARTGWPADAGLPADRTDLELPDLSPFPPLPCPSRLPRLSSSSLVGAPAASAFCIGYAGPEAEALLERYSTLEDPVRSGEKLVFPLALKVWYFASMKLRFGENTGGAWFCFWECGKPRWKSERGGKK